MKSYFVLLLIASLASSSLYAIRTDMTREQKITLLRGIREKFAEDKQAEVAKSLGLLEEYQDLYESRPPSLGTISVPTGAIRW